MQSRYYHPQSMMSLFPSLQPGVRLVDAEELLDLATWTMSGKLVRGGTAATHPTLLEAHINDVVAGTHVELPLALPGNIVFVVRPATVHAKLINPTIGAPDRVNGAAQVTQTGISMYICYALGQWVQSNLPGVMPALSPIETAAQTNGHG